MHYVDALRSRLDAARHGKLRWVELWPAEVGSYQQKLALALERVDDDYDRSRTDELFRRWSDPEFLLSLLTALHQALLDLSLDLTAADLVARVDYAFHWLLAEDSASLIDPLTSPWPRLHTRLLERTAEAVGVEQMAYRHAWVPSPQRYAERLGLLRRAEDSAALSTSGDLLLRLPPSEIPLWLLTLELAPHPGQDDSWRVSPALVASLRKTAEVAFSHRDWTFAPLGERGDFESEYRTLKRLQALRIVTSHQPDADDEYGRADGLETFRLTPHGRELLKDLEQVGSPLSLLAAAVSRDHAAGISADPLQLLPAREPGASAVGDTVRHMHLVAHEFRNALVPVQVAFDRLWRRLPRPVASPALDGYRATILAGLRRMFDSVDESARIARMAPAPPEPFDLTAALREAVSAVQPEFVHEVALDPRLGAASALLVGHRRRFVLALVNLLRNAHQANTSAVKVGLGLLDDTMPAALALTIDDDGRGVPEEHRQAVFQVGVSLRKGGSGHGLALVHEVIVDEMRGTVVCTTSPLGGARFILQLPRLDRGAP